jgi:hypothetical protein
MVFMQNPNNLCDADLRMVTRLITCEGTIFSENQKHFACLLKVMHNGM